MAMRRLPWQVGAIALLAVAIGCGPATTVPSATSATCPGLAELREATHELAAAADSVQQGDRKGAEGHGTVVADLMTKAIDAARSIPRTPNTENVRLQMGSLTAFFQQAIGLLLDPSLDLDASRVQVIRQLSGGATEQLRVVEALTATGCS